MTADAGSLPISIGLVETVFTSEHVPSLFVGRNTHNPAMLLIAQLVRHIDDDPVANASDEHSSIA